MVDVGIVLETAGVSDAECTFITFNVAVHARRAFVHVLCGCAMARIERVLGMPRQILPVSALSAVFE